MSLMMDEWVRKCNIYQETQTMDHYSGRHEKEGNFAICDNMGEPDDIMLNEISHTEKDKNCMISPMWNQKKKERK